MGESSMGSADADVAACPSCFFEEQQTQSRESIATARKLRTQDLNIDGLILAVL
jgi:hypothetical protein